MSFALIKRLAIIYLCLFVFYISFLTVAFLLPQDNIEKHALENIDILVVKEEHAYRYNRDIKLLCNGPASYVDALTDAVMLTRNVNYNTNKSEEALSIQNFFRFPHNFSSRIYDNPLLNALNMNGYGRYWHGYEIVLRPLLVFFNYLQIRYFSMFVLALFFISAGIALYKDCGLGMFIGYTVAFIMCKFPLIPLSMQFMNMIILMLAVVLFCHYWFLPYEKDRLCRGTFHNTYSLIFILGSLTVFFDLLTVPLLPVGIILLYLLVYFQKHYSYTLPWKFFVMALGIWACGCIATWCAKWVIYSCFLDVNMLQEAYKQIVFRMQAPIGLKDGNVMEASSILALLVNIIMLVAPLPIAYAFGILIAVLILLCLGRYFFANPYVCGGYLEKLGFLGLLPCLWYMVIKNHSQIHYWYTYRCLIMTIMAFGMYCEHVIDWQALFKRRSLDA